MSNGKPFVIFVDELDRCRPLYAIELLERIKHLFGINNLIFVLSIDKEQLGLSIQSQYGQIDTDNYLRRFIDLEFRLISSDIDMFCEGLLSKLKIREGIKNDIILFIKYYKFSLREIEQIIKRIYILFKIGDNNTNLLILIFLEILKNSDAELYKSLIERKADREDFKELIIFFYDNSIDKSGVTLDSFIFILLNKDIENTIKYNIYKESAYRKEFQAIFNSRFETMYKHYFNNIYGDFIDNYIKDLEFAGNFNI
jgi:hypothetical protein